MSNPVEPGTTAARIYLDHNATTPLHSRVSAAMGDALGLFGNPSSIHGAGRAARTRVEAARAQVAALLGVPVEEVLFTSGGTESNALGMLALYRAARTAGRAARVAVLAIEHPSVHGAAQLLADAGAEILSIPVDGGGRVDAAGLAEVLAAEPAVVALALANHELGVRIDDGVAARCREAGARVFRDAVQGAGKVALSAADLSADALSISAHKMYGPKGIGALWVRAGIPVDPLTGPGHQERGRRAGTENVLGAIGFGAAAEVVLAEGPASGERMTALSQRLEQAILAVPGGRIHGRGPRVPGTVNAAFAGARGEIIVQALDLAGVEVSSGAACTSGTSKPSAVLLALGLPPERAAEAVRFSLGYGTTLEEIDKTAALLPAVCERARRFARNAF